MKLRSPLAALAVAGLAAALLTGCQSNVGAAAHVEDKTISVADVDDRITTVSDDDAAKLGRTSSQLRVLNRQTVLIFSVREVLFEQVWRQRGGLPPQPRLDQKHDAAIQYLFGSSGTATGAAGDDAVREALETNGVKPGFADTMIRAAELELLLADEIKAGSEADVIALVNDAGIDVRVSERYGSWDSSSLTLGAPATPSYLVRGPDGASGAPST